MRKILKKINQHKLLTFSEKYVKLYIGTINTCIITYFFAKVKYDSAKKYKFTFCKLIMGRERGMIMEILRDIIQKLWQLIITSVITSCIANLRTLVLAGGLLITAVTIWFAYTKRKKRTMIIAVVTFVVYTIIGLLMTM